MTKSVYVAGADDLSIAAPEIAIQDEFKQALKAHAAASLASDPDSADMVVFFESWSTQQPSYVHKVERDPFFQKHWKKIYTINDDDIVPGLLPGLYTSLERHTYDPGIHRTCAYPRTYNVEVEKPQDVVLPQALATFRGKPSSSPLRDRMIETLSGSQSIRVTVIQQQFHSHSEGQKNEYVHDILSAHAVLCPRGWSPSTYRVFETMALGRCPIIIADDWIAIEGVDWDGCSIRVAEDDIHRLDAIVKEREADLPGLGRTAQRVYNACFSSRARSAFFVNQLLELHENRSHRDYRRDWSSIQYWRQRGEGVRSQVKRRAKALFGA